MKPPILSHHLGILLDKGIMEERKEGREKYDSISQKKRAFARNIIKIVG